MIFDILGADGIMDIALARSLRRAVDNKLNGWPDLMRFNAERFSFVEVKSPNDKPSPPQIEVARELIAAGIDVVELRVTPLEGSRMG
ncbi:VRR-NUC domain-containing protein [Paracoccus sp. KR1-242]|uniref:VRR-NUC domain-containing protein n=1 Tax=Paracoccus sp. KR1-242 TaxID=3410028 RepID=UPI003C0EF082